MKIKYRSLMLSALLAATGAYADSFGTGSNQFSITFIEIGHIGNPEDTVSVVNGSGLGAVDYSYRMAIHEVTVDQFAKARAADSRIGNGNEGYWNDGIRNVGAEAPASSNSWYEAAMFANWLTSGDAYVGAYLFDTNGALIAVDRAAAKSTYGTVYVLPSEDEWYKAAYYKSVGDGTYSFFSNGDNSPPLRGTTNGWNYSEYTWPEGPLVITTVNSAPDYVWETGSGGEEQNGT